MTEQHHPTVEREEVVRTADGSLPTEAPGPAGGPGPGPAHRFRLSVRSALQLAFTISLAALVLWRTDVGGAIDTFRDLDPFFGLAAIALLIASNMLHSWKWQKLLECLGHVRLRELVAVFWASMATNNVIPLRAGDVLRVQVLSQRTGIARTGILATLVTERVLDSACFLLLLAIGIPALEGGSNLWGLTVGLGALLFGLLAATVMAARMDVAMLEQRRWFRALPRRAQDVTQRLLPSFVDGLKPLGSWQSGSEAGILALSAWLLEALAYWCIGLAFGLDANPIPYLVVMVAVNAASAITILPANLGLYELTAVGIMTAMGASGGGAAAYAIGSHLLVIFTISGVGLLALWYLRVGFEDIFYLRARARSNTGEARS